MAYKSTPGTEDDETILCPRNCRKPLKMDRISVYNRSNQTKHREKNILKQRERYRLKKNKEKCTTSLSE